MNLRNFAKLALIPALGLALMAGQCENRNVKPLLKYVPDHYRQCFEKVVRIEDYETNGQLLWKDAQRLIVDLRSSELKKTRCGKQAIKWMDAQVNAYNRYAGQ